MSGQQIGTVVGGIIGSFIPVVGTELGMAIGGLIGGLVDPGSVSGPHIGDGQKQTATDGVPIAWIQGTGKIAGNLVAVGPRYEVKVQDSGKGGPSVYHYEAHQTFAILVCESDQIKGSSISAVVTAEQDGKIVYDMRPESNFTGPSSKWARGVHFYYGEESQLPPPELEAIFGVGQVPGYRGVLLALFKDFNLSPFGDRIPTYLFTVSSSGTVLPSASYWKALITTEADDTDYSGVDFDDSSWLFQQAPFGNPLNYLSPMDTFSYVNTLTPVDATIWLRKIINVPQYLIDAGNFTCVVAADDGATVYVNGNEMGTVNYEISPVTTFTIPHIAFSAGPNLIAVKAIGWAHHVATYIDLRIISPNADPSLALLVSNICLRGGLNDTQFDVSELEDITVGGYPIATQCSATDALAPLLSTFFSYGSEYDGKIFFKLYGQDSQITINPNDILVNDATDGAIQRTKRNQATEFPRRVVGSYVDPAQNYNTVTQKAERLAQTVIAIGEISLQMPVTIDETVAVQAVDKALKVAYATLEGTIEFSLPYAMPGITYLSIVAGDPIIFDAKRWVLDQVDIGSGFLKLTGRYDRQSAYTSDVQAIAGNPPIPPVSMYSGPTDLLVANLPSLRTQDLYGIYAFAKGEDPTSWRGCTLQVSYDGQESWSNAMSILNPSVMGKIVGDADATTGSGADADTVVDVGTDEISSVSDDQIAAGANAFAIIDSAGVPEIRQAKTAALQVDNTYELTDQFTGLLGTTFVEHAADEDFTMLASAYFLPIDLSFKGKTLYFRAVGFGEVAEDSEIISLVYNPDTTLIHDGGLVTGS